jgi:hypothetical protein
VNYGLKLNWDNVSGRRDKLNFNFVNGYTREYSIFYEQPYADKKLERGFLGAVFFKQSRQMAFATDSNKQAFFPVSNAQINEFVRTTFKMEAGYTIRKGVNHRHTFRLSYSNESIPDTISQLIPSRGIFHTLRTIDLNSNLVSFPIHTSIITPTTLYIRGKDFCSMEHLCKGVWALRE